MDLPVTQALLGAGASLLTQAVKRDQGSALENILLSLGAALGASHVAGQGLDPMIPVFSYAFHGLMGGQKPMQSLKLSLIDKVLEAVGGAFSSASSKNGKPTT